MQYAFFGLRAGVLALILKAFWNMAKKQKKKKSIIIAAAAFLLAAVLRLNVLLVIILCAAAGLISAWLAEGRLKK